MPAELSFIFGLASVAVLIVCLVHLSGWLGEWSTKQEKQEDEQRQKNRDDRTADRGQPAGNAVVGRLDSLVDQLEAQYQQTSRHDRKNTTLEVVGVTAAIAAAIFALWLATTTSVQLDEGRKTNALQLRAYVFANIVTPLNDFAPGQKIYSVIFANGGETPAYVLAYRLHADVVAVNPPTTITDEFRVPGAPHGIVTGDYVFKEHTKQYFSRPVTIDQQRSDAISRGTAAIVFWGTMTYRDVFGCWHYASFCALLQAAQGAPPGQYECPSHNDIDDPTKCDKN
jgi:hypothetical protein